VHLAGFPEAGASDPRLEEGMRQTRVLARLGRAAREEVRIRVRQPLGTLQAVVPDASLMTDELLAVLRDELNVKRVQFLQAAGDLVTLRAQPSFRQIGKRFGSHTQDAAAAIRALDDAALRAFRDGQEVAIEVSGERRVLEAGDLDVVEESAGDLVVSSDEGCTIALDPAIDEPLRLEGIARELVNRIQRLRKDTGLAVSDRIRLAVFGDASVQAALAAHEDYIMRETLAVAVDAAGEPDARWRDTVQDVDLDGITVRLALRRA
jgi:isoleucyl-tRNA synthetase